MSKARSVVEFPNEYIVLDTETTGLEVDYDQIIEIGMLKIRNDEIVDRFSSIIHPTQSFCFIPFTELQSMGKEEIDEYVSSHLIPEYITELTGITNEMVVSAPFFSELSERIQNFIGDLPIIGHNITFDYRFLNSAFLKNNFSPLDNSIICTMRISRKFLPELEHHRLSDVCQTLEVNQGISHRALDDAEATFSIFSKIYNDLHSKGEIENFIRSFSKKQINYNEYANNLKPITNQIDDTNPLFQKVVVFTGALSSMSRKEAFQLVVDRGGIPSDSLTKKTNFLVVGNEDFVESVKNGKTNKMKKAEKYQIEGIDISIVSENTFFEVLVE